MTAEPLDRQATRLTYKGHNHQRMMGGRSACRPTNRGAYYREYNSTINCSLTIGCISSRDGM
jgi:hypothetical protein